MSTDILQTRIKTCLSNPNVLTDKELKGLLEDCLNYFMKEDFEKLKFHETYESIMKNAKARTAAASTLLKDFSQIADMIRGLNVQKDQS